MVLVDGELTLYMERGGKSLLAWPTDPADPALHAAAQALASAARAGTLGTVTVERTNGVSSLTSPLGKTLRPPASWPRREVCGCAPECGSGPDGASPRPPRRP